MLSEVLYEADLQTLQQDYASRIESLKTQILTGEGSEEQMAQAAEHIAAYLEEWVRQAEREDLMKAAETARTQAFPIYVEMALLWLKDEQSTANQLRREREKLFAGFSPEQCSRIQDQIRLIQRQQVDDSHRRLAALSLTTRTHILRTQGSELSHQLLQICSAWDASDRSYLPSVVNLILTQRACDLEPALADSPLHIAHAYAFYRAELQSELEEFERALERLFLGLQPILAGGSPAEIE